MSDRLPGTIIKYNPILYQRFTDSGPDDIGGDPLVSLIGPDGVYSNTANITLSQPSGIPNSYASKSINIQKAGGSGAVFVCNTIMAAEPMPDSGDATMIVWMDSISSSATNNQPFVGKWTFGAASLKFGIRIDSVGVLQFESVNSTPSTVDIDSTPNTGDTKMYAVTVGGTTVTPYINGVAGTTGTLTVKDFGGSPDVEIRMRAVPGVNGVNFNIQDTAYFNTALSADAINEIYRAGSSAMNFTNRVGRRLASGRTF